MQNGVRLSLHTESTVAFYQPGHQGRLKVETNFQLCLN